MCVHAVYINGHCVIGANEAKVMAMHRQCAAVYWIATIRRIVYQLKDRWRFFILWYCCCFCLLLAVRLYVKSMKFNRSCVYGHSSIIFVRCNWYERRTHLFVLILIKDFLASTFYIQLTRWSFQRGLKSLLKNFLNILCMCGINKMWIDEFSWTPIDQCCALQVIG